MPEFIKVRLVPIILAGTCTLHLYGGACIKGGTRPFSYQKMKSGQDQLLEPYAELYPAQRIMDLGCLLGSTAANSLSSECYGPFV